MFGFRSRKENLPMIDEKRINKIVDYTCIQPTLTRKELERHCLIAYKNKYSAIVVNPVNVEMVRAYIDYKLKSSINLVCVIGYPLGENTTETKVFEVKKAVQDGADELDVMISVSRIKMGEYGYIKNELSRIVKASKRRVVKVIVETAYLNKTELTKVASICSKCKVNFIQTSSGFANGGAQIEDIEIIRSAVNGKVEIKASGAIENRNQAIIMLRAGASRIGTSREI